MIENIIKSTTSELQLTKCKLFSLKSLFFVKKRPISFAKQIIKPIFAAYLRE